MKNTTTLFQTFERHVVRILFHQLIRTEVQVTVEVRMVLLPRQRDRNDMKQRQDRDINLLQERRIILDLIKTSTSLTIIRTEMATLPRNLILRQVAEDLDQKQVKFR